MIEYIVAFDTNLTVKGEVTRCKNCKHHNDECLWCKKLQRETENDCYCSLAERRTDEVWDKFGCDPDGKLARYDDDKHYVPYVRYEDMVYAVKNLPSVQPQRWIPVTERLPEHSGFYIVTAIVTDDGGKLVGLRWFSQEHGWKFGKNPLAWMPLPEPYKEKKNETD